MLRNNEPKQKIPKEFLRSITHSPRYYRYLALSKMYNSQNFRTASQPIRNVKTASNKITVRSKHAKALKKSLPNVLPKQRPANPQLKAMLFLQEKLHRISMEQTAKKYQTVREKIDRTYDWYAGKDMSGLIRCLRRYQKELTERNAREAQKQWHSIALPKKKNLQDTSKPKTVLITIPLSKYIASKGYNTLIRYKEGPEEDYDPVWSPRFSSANKESAATTIYKSEPKRKFKRAKSYMNISSIPNKATAKTEQASPERMNTATEASGRGKRLMVRRILSKVKGEICEGFHKEQEEG